MSAGRKIWTVGWRLLVCALLMLWILHAIFLNEGKSVFERQGGKWESLSRSAQWESAWTHGPRELWQTLTLIDPVAGALSLVFMGLTIFIGIYRWHMVLRIQGLGLPLARAAEISLVAHFFNSFLLGSTGGDLIKAYYAARETHHKKPEAVATVFLDRIIGLFAMLLFAGLMMIPNFNLIASDNRLGTLSAFILLMLLGCGGLVLVALWGGVSKTVPKAREWLRRLPKADVLERALDACRSFGKERGFLARALGVSMVLNAVCVLQFIALAWGMGLSIPVTALFVIVPMIICVSALPITPSGLGVRENLYVLILASPLFGVAATHALSLSLLAYAGSLFWSLIGGVVYATLRERHHLAEVTRSDSASEAP